jgi:hypothetical protein
MGLCRTRARLSVRQGFGCHWWWLRADGDICLLLLTVDIEENTESAQQNTQGALHNVREANLKRGFCKCSKTKLICIGIFALVVVVAIVAIVVAVK